MLACEPGANAWVEKNFHDCVYDIRDTAGFVLGLVSILFWVFAQLPQVISNMKNQTAEALSPWFLAQWFLGDTLNLLGCLVQGEQLPTTTYLAMYFVLSDLIMLMQYIYYGALHKRREKLLLQEHHRRRHHHRHGHHQYHGHHHRRPGHQGIQGNQAQLPGQGLGTADILGPPAPPLPPAPAPPPLQGERDLQHERDQVEWQLQSEHEEHAHRDESLSIFILQRERGGESQSVTPPALLTSLTLQLSVVLGSGTMCLLVALLCGKEWLHRGGSLRGLPPSNIQSGLKLIRDQHAVWRQPSVSGITPSCNGDDFVEPWWCDEDAIEMMLGTAMGYLSMCLYLSSRISQIVKNAARQSAEGLSLAMFCLAVTANMCTGCSILLRTTELEALKNQLPWIIGAFGTVSMDVTIAWQSLHYTRLHKLKDVSAVDQPLLE